MNFKEIYVKDIVQWLDVVNTVMSLQALSNAVSLLIT
jgi:hypothetical protein